MQEKEGVIDLFDWAVDYLRTLRRMILWAVFFMILGAAAFSLRTYVQYEPRYTASSTFTITMEGSSRQTDYTSGVSYYDSRTASQMEKTFPHILTSSVLRRKVSQEMGIPLTEEMEIQATAVEKTNLFTISVTDSDAERAYVVLQSVIRNYPQFSEVIVGKVDMQLVDETGIPPRPDNVKNYREAVALGALAGLALVMIWAAAVVFLRRTIQREKDIREKLNLRCLGSVPEVMMKKRSKKKSYLVLTDENIDQQFQESIRMIRNKVEHYAHANRKKIFLITSALAGEGKSTIAVNLALSLAHNGKRVFLADCDLRHPTDRNILGLEKKDGLREALEEKKEGLREVLEGKKSLKECVLRGKEIGLEEDSTFSFLPGGAGMEDGSELLGTDRMREILEQLREEADYVILDSAPSGLLTDAVVLAKYADAGIFVVRRDFARMDFVSEGIDHLAESGITMAGAILNASQERHDRKKQD